MRWAAFIATLLCTGAVMAGVATYEGDVFPEFVGWERVGTFDADRSIVDGWLVIEVDLGLWAPLPYGELDAYKRGIAEFAGQTFFLEWRCITDAPNSEIYGTGGSIINAWGGGVSYHVTMAQDQVRFRRDNSIPFLFVNIEPGVPHTYRVELYGDQLYTWYIDGAVVDSGVPEGPFPNADGQIIWGSRMWMTPSANHWDYVRYGTIPQDGSGDFDSNGVDLDDLYFFQDCLLGPDADGPGCSWADMNDDRKVDGADIPAFVDALLAPPQPTRAGPGVQSVSFDTAARE
jgi:hypothetical protein